MCILSIDLDYTNTLLESNTLSRASRIRAYVGCRANSVVLTLGQSKLAKFVQINWCGEGVPESKKGLFRACFGTGM